MNQNNQERVRDDYDAIDEMLQNEFSSNAGAGFNAETNNINFQSSPVNIHGGRSQIHPSSMPGYQVSSATMCQPHLMQRTDSTSAPLSHNRVGTPSGCHPGQVQDVCRSHASSPAHWKHFLVFVKILFKVLEKGNNTKLKCQAKAVVHECIRRNRMGDPNFSPLKEVVELRLRGMVGEFHWNRTSFVFQSLGSRGRPNKSFCIAQPRAR